MEDRSSAWGSARSNLEALASVLYMPLFAFILLISALVLFPLVILDWILASALHRPEEIAPLWSAWALAWSVTATFIATHNAFTCFDGLKDPTFAKFAKVLGSSAAILAPFLFWVYS